MEEATDEEIKDDNTSDISQSQEGEEVRGKRQRFQGLQCYTLVYIITIFHLKTIWQ